MTEVNDNAGDSSSCSMTPSTNDNDNNNNNNETHQPVEVGWEDLSPAERIQQLEKKKPIYLPHPSDSFQATKEVINPAVPLSTLINPQTGRPLQSLATNQDLLNASLRQVVSDGHHDIPVEDLTEEEVVEEELVVKRVRDPPKVTIRSPSAQRSSAVPDMEWSDKSSSSESSSSSSSESGHSKRTKRSHRGKGKGKEKESARSFTSSLATNGVPENFSRIKLRGDAFQRFANVKGRTTEQIPILPTQAPAPGPGPSAQMQAPPLPNGFFQVPVDNVHGISPDARHGLFESDEYDGAPSKQYEPIAVASKNNTFTQIPNLGQTTGASSTTVPSYASPQYPPTQPIPLQYPNANPPPPPPYQANNGNPPPQYTPVNQTPSQQPQQPVGQPSKNYEHMYHALLRQLQGRETLSERYELLKSQAQAEAALKFGLEGHTPPAYQSISQHSYTPTVNQNRVNLGLGNAPPSGYSNATFTPLPAYHPLQVAANNNTYSHPTQAGGPANAHYQRFQDTPPLIPITNHSSVDEFIRDNGVPHLYDGTGYPNLSVDPNTSFQDPRKNVNGTKPSMDYQLAALSASTAAASAYGRDKSMQVNPTAYNQLAFYPKPAMGPELPGLGEGYTAPFEPIASTPARTIDIRSAVVSRPATVVREEKASDECSLRLANIENILKQAYDTSSASRLSNIENSIKQIHDDVRTVGIRMTNQSRKRTATQKRLPAPLPVYDEIDDGIYNDVYDDLEQMNDKLDQMGSMLESLTVRSEERPSRRRSRIPRERLSRGHWREVYA